MLSKSCDDVCDPVIDVPNDEPCVVESVTADKPAIAEIPAKDTSTMSQACLAELTVENNGVTFVENQKAFIVNGNNNKHYFQKKRVNVRLRERVIFWQRVSKLAIIYQNRKK